MQEKDNTRCSACFISFGTTLGGGVACETSSSRECILLMQTCCWPAQTTCSARCHVPMYVCINVNMYVCASEHVCVCVRVCMTSPEYELVSHAGQSGRP